MGSLKVMFKILFALNMIIGVFTIRTKAASLSEMIDTDYTGMVQDENGKRYFLDSGVVARDKEVFDPQSDAWYWFDSNGIMATNKDVFIPTNVERTEGKWVRYNETGGMVKGEDYCNGGWYYFEPVTGTMMKGPVILEDGRKVFYDTITGQMLKGTHKINQQIFVFDENDGHLISGNESLFWIYADGKSYWYENWKRQGWDPLNNVYRGKEIFDPASNAWYWLDNVQQGAKAISKDVYQESSGGKWVRYDANGSMVKGWSVQNGNKCYFDLTTGAMAKGNVVIDGVSYSFDEITGILQEDGGGSSSGEMHTHSYTSTVTIVPSCVKMGIKTYKCSCGDMYTEDIPKNSHNYMIKEVGATCIDKGYVEHKCSVCGDVYKDSYVNELGHSYKSDITKVATCKEAGEKTYTCIRCNDFYKERVPATGRHNWDDGKVIKEASYASDGKKMYTCTICETTKIENIEKLPSDYDVNLPLPELTGNDVNDFLAIAESQIGYKESNTHQTIYADWAGQNGRAWCSEFVAWCAYQAGISTDIIPIGTSTKKYRAFYANVGQYYILDNGQDNKSCGCESLANGSLSINEIEPGDILLVTTSSHDYSEGANHTCLCVEVRNGIVYTIEGNYSGMVSRGRRRVEAIHGVCKPCFSGRK